MNAFALLKSPHLHKAYLEIVCKWISMTVSKEAIIGIPFSHQQDTELEHTSFSFVLLKVIFTILPKRSNIFNRKIMLSHNLSFKSKGLKEPRFSEKLNSIFKIKTLEIVDIFKKSHSFLTTNTLPGQDQYSVVY